MVNIGRPSRGCAVCRRRRIKCDEKEPQCSYCVKTNQRCPGYKDDFTLAWRDQTASAGKKVQQRKRAQHESSQEDTSSDDSQQPRTISRRFSPVPVLPREYPEDHALSYFFRTHVLGRDPEVCYGFVEHIPIVFVNAKPGSPLYHAVSTIAMRMFEPWFDARREFPMSKGLYHKALSKVREQVEAKKDCWSDEFLMAVLLLDFFEGLQAQVGTKVNTHVRGAAALVRGRPPETFQSDNSKALLLALRHVLTATAIRTKTPFPIDIYKYISKVPNPPESSARSLDGIQLHVANLQAASLALADPTKTLTLPTFASLYPFSLEPDDPYFELRDSLLTPQTIIYRALDIDTQLLTWARQAPEFIPPVKVHGDAIPPSVREAGMYGDYAEVYQSIYSANVWNIYRTLRVRVSGMILDCLPLLRNQSPEVEDFEAAQIPTILKKSEKSYAGIITNAPLFQHDIHQSPFPLDKSSLYNHAVSAIQSSADGICAAVPWFFGDRTGHSTNADDRTIKFPVIPGQKVPEEHYRTTAGIARWFLIGPFSVTLASKAELRPGQKDWIRAQLARSSKVHGGPRADGG